MLSLLSPWSLMLGLPLAFLILNVVVRRIGARGQSRANDYWLGVDLSFAGLSSALLAIAQAMRPNAAVTYDVAGVAVTAVAMFVGLFAIIYMHQLCEEVAEEWWKRLVEVEKTCEQIRAASSEREYEEARTQLETIGTSVKPAQASSQASGVKSPRELLRIAEGLRKAAKSRKGRREYHLLVWVGTGISVVLFSIFIYIKDVRPELREATPVKAAKQIGNKGL